MLNLESLKKIKNTEFIEYANKYITEKLELNKVDYQWEIVKTTIINIKKGIKELCEIKNVDFSIFEQLFTFVENYAMKDNYFNVVLDFKYSNDFNVWRKVATYNMECSIRNDKGKLLAFPKFEFVDSVQECNMYDFILYVVSLEKQDLIEKLELINLEYNKKIIDNLNKIEILNKIKL